MRLFALGAELEVTLEGEHAREAEAGMRRLWARCLQPSEAQSVAEPLTYEPPTPAAAKLVGLTQEITRRLIAAQRGRMVMFHAGAVCNPDTGDSLVYVAPGGTGKTTLSKVLGQTHSYLTDETVAIDESGRIWPYPKPLSIRTGPGKLEFSPDDLGLQPTHAAPFARKIVILARDQGQQAEELSEVSAICALVTETSSLSDLPAGLHQLRDLISLAGPVVRHHYAEAEHLAAELVAGL